MTSVFERMNASLRIFQLQGSGVSLDDLLQEHLDSRVEATLEQTAAIAESLTERKTDMESSITNFTTEIESIPVLNAARFQSNNLQQKVHELKGSQEALKVELVKRRIQLQEQAAKKVALQQVLSQITAAQKSKSQMPHKEQISKIGSNICIYVRDHTN